MVWLEMMRRRDVYVLLILLAALLLCLVSVDIFHLSGVVNYAKDLGLLLAWLFSWILAVIVVSRELPGEEAQGTIYSLLAKPVTRGELIVGKWLGAWTVVSVSTTCFYALLAVIVLLKGGIFHWVTTAQGLALHICALSIICAVGMLFSTRLNPDAAVTTSFLVTGTSMFFVPKIPRMLFLIERDMEWIQGWLIAAYYAFPHLELFDLRRKIVHNDAPAGWLAAGQAVLYAILITSALLLLAWAAYSRKTLSRGRQI